MSLFGTIDYVGVSTMQRLHYGNELSSDYVQIVHHVQKLSDHFYDEIGAHGYFFDAPKWLREGKKYGVKSRLEMYEKNRKQVYTWDSLPNRIILK